jgi:hypothetical protein
VRAKPRGRCMEVFAAYNFPTLACRVKGEGIMKAQTKLSQDSLAFVDSFGAVRTLSGASSPLLGAECQARCTRSSSHRSSWSVKARSGCGVRAASAALSNSDRAWTVGAAKRGGHVANRAWRASFVDVGSNNYQIFPPAPTCRSVFLPLLAR